jgi:prolyl-tRNA editing enzyme YbaK/EbsC (Cys-tRNA(Pro) deacylase)
VLQASRLLDVNHKVRELMGVSRVSFANAEETVRVTGMLVGGVTVFALPEGMAIYVDEPVMSLDYAILGGGGRSSKIKLTPRELLRVPGLEVVAGLATDRPR